MKKDMRRGKGNLLQKTMAVLLSVVLVVGMLVTNLPQTEVYAAGDTIASGTDWTLDADGILTITSDAGMEDWIAQGRNNNVTKVVIENGVTSIGEHAFYECSSLEEVTIPASVTSIGKYAFYHCSSLEEVTIPDGVTSIGQMAFSYCNRLTSMRVEEENMVYDSREDCNAIIETDSNTLIAGCNKTVIPDGVTSIGEYAFYDCSSLEEVTIPSSVTSIGMFAFYGCYNLEEVTIPSSVTSVNDILIL